MIQDLGVAGTTSQVGFYSGLVVRSIVSSFSVGRSAVFGERNQRGPLLIFLLRTLRNRCLLYPNYCLFCHVPGYQVSGFCAKVDLD